MARCQWFSSPTTTRQYYYPERRSYADLTLQEVPLVTPKPNEVLVKNHAVSLQVLIFSEYPISTKSVQPDLVPCSDMAGEVIAVGADVTQWRVGDRVSPNFMLDKLHDEQTVAIGATALGAALHGVLTEYKIFPAHSLVAIPAHLTYEEAASLPCAALTAYKALTSGNSPIKAGDTILVLGTGGVSIFALQFAVASGATVIALSSSDEKLKQAAKLGAKYVINYKATPQWDQEVLKLTDGLGVDEIDGSIDLIGVVGGSAPPVGLILPSITKGLTIRGIYVGSVAQFNDMNRLMSANIEVTRPVIDKVFPFEEAKAAFAYFESQVHVGKVVIKF
ncbi:alcohol dehydrogenase [Mycena epipterygia]|nr:alcohol dehydrogenase [Mycena epipterygia]